MMGRGDEGRGDLPPPVPPLKPEWRSTQMQRRHSPDQAMITNATKIFENMKKSKTIKSSKLLIKMILPIHIK